MVTIGDSDSSVTFSNVVDAVSDLGMDNSGGEPISGIIDGVPDGTLIEMPPGDYRVSRENNRWDKTIGFRGRGASRSETRFVFDRDYGDRWFRHSGGFAMVNLTWFIRDDNTTVAGAYWDGSHGIVRDVEYAGRIPDDGQISRNEVFVVEARPASAVFHVDRFGMRGGAEHPGYPNGLAGFRVYTGHYGEARFTNSHFEAMGSSPVRDDKSRGVTRQYNCLFRNNDNTNLRVQGGEHPRKDGVIDGCVVIVDGDVSSQPYSRPGDEMTGKTHGLRVESERTANTLHVTDTDIRFEVNPNGNSNVYISAPWDPQERVELSNCRFMGGAGVSLVSGDGGPHIFTGGSLIGSPVSGNVQLNNVCTNSGCEEPVSSSEVTSPIDGGQLGGGGGGGTVPTPDPDPGSLPNTITVTGSGVQTNYRFAVGGEVQPYGDVEPWDSYGSGSVDSWITTDGSTDTWGFSGGVESFEFVEGSASVSVNGEPVDASSDPSGWVDSTGGGGGTGSGDDLVTVGSGAKMILGFVVARELLKGERGSR